MDWSISFVVAASVALVVTPLLGRVPLAGMVFDRTEQRRRGQPRTPAVGGVALVAAITAGAVVTGKAGVTSLLALALGFLLTALGTAHDRGKVKAPVRMAAITAAALTLCATGTRAEATGSLGVDVAVTFAIVLVITMTVSGFDNAHALKGWVCGTTSLAFFLLAAAAGQEQLASLAVASAGACVALVAYTARPAATRIGSGGGLFLGLLLATMSLEVGSVRSPPATLVPPMLLLAVPFLDTATAAVGRLRRGKPALAGGRDHLSHRLRARGLGRGTAGFAVAAVHAVLCGLGVATGRGLVPLPLAVGAAAVVLIVLAVVTIPARISRRTVRGLPRGVRLAMALAVAGMAMATAPTALAMLLARGAVNDGAHALEAGLDATRAGDTAGAGALFGQARSHFGHARSRLSNPATSLGLTVPGLAPNLRAARALGETGEALARTGQGFTQAVSARDLGIRGGRLPVEQAISLAPELDNAASALRGATERVRAVRRPYLVPPLDDAVRKLDTELEAASRDAEGAIAAVRLMPSALGTTGTRRYFLAVQNNAEARATGGFIGNYGEIVAEGGSVRLDRFGRIGELNDKGKGRRLLGAPKEYLDRYARFSPATTWQSVNMSPDLPTVTQVIADLYPQSSGRPIDGVIAVDPVGLSALLELTGPITVAPWPEPITAGNVVDVTLNQAYVRLPREQRIEFIGDVAERAVRTATTADLGSPIRVISALSRVTYGRHLMVAFTRPDEHGLVRQLGVGGGVPPVRTDSVFAVTQNAAGNKVDYYLRRRLRYDLRLEPDDDARTARLEGTVEMELDNTTPPGLPDTVVGPFDPRRFVAGENVTFLSVYSPHDFRRATLEGRPVSLEAGHELGRRVYSTFVSVPAGTRKTLTLEVSGRVELQPGGWYSLDLRWQPLLAPEKVDVSVRVPPPWRVSDTRGGVAGHGNHNASGQLDLVGDRTVQVRLERPEAEGVIARLIGEA